MSRSSPSSRAGKSLPLDAAARADAASSAGEGPDAHRREARPVKPLGTARRPTRSRTPTPNNPHPNASTYQSQQQQQQQQRQQQQRHLHSPRHPALPPTFAATSRPGSSSASLLVGGIPAASPFPIPRSGRSSFGPSENAYETGSASAASAGKQRSSSSGASGSNGAQPERRPWFPYPAATPSLSVPRERRPSASSSTADGSTAGSSWSSASSYNSADITSLHASRRAISAEPEEWSQALSRGRPLRRRPSDALMSSKEEDEEGEEAATAAAKAADPQRADGSKGKAKQSSASSGSLSSTDDEKERAHFQSVLKAFDAYITYSLAQNNARRRSFYALPRSHRLLLASLGPTLPGPLLPRDGKGGGQAEHTVVGGHGFKARLDEIDDRIRRNADVLAQIVSDSRGFLGGEEEASEEGGSGKEPVPDSTTPVPTPSAKGSSGSSGDAARSHTHDEHGSRGGSRSKSRLRAALQKERKRASEHDVDKVRSTIKQFVRDWSEEGAEERNAAYDPILDALEEHFAAVSSAQRGQVRVLVPGAGLGRLAFEIAWRGFSCQGNEFSFYMLLASHFILNKTTHTDQHTLYPFVHSSSNWRAAQHMLRPVRIPDINPSDLPTNVDFSMVAGEFVEVYGKKQEAAAWDAIATCFFIDTAHNFARYLEVINHALPVGGVWINVGPLLWHFEGAASAEQGDISIELTLEEAVGLIELMGFAIEQQRTLPPQPYTGNPFSMLAYEYSPEFWLARKVRDTTPATDV